MVHRNPNTGFPPCPCDHIMRTEEGADTRGWFAERHRHAHRDPPGYRPKVARGAAAVVAAVVAALWLAGCGGEVSAKVDPTADPKVEVKWERELSAHCELPAQKRVEQMNTVNNALLNTVFILVVCPQTDPLNTDATPLLVDGTPAMAVQAKVLYLFPGKGEQVNKHGGDTEQASHGVRFPAAPTNLRGVRASGASESSHRGAPHLSP